MISYKIWILSFPEKKKAYSLAMLGPCSSWQNEINVSNGYSPTGGTSHHSIIFPLTMKAQFPLCLVSFTHVYLNSSCQYIFFVSPTTLY